MLTLPSGTNTTVFTATTPGVFTLVLVGGGDLLMNTQTIVSAATGQHSAAVFMTTGDVLKYTGSDASLAGFRNGNEFDD